MASVERFLNCAPVTSRRGDAVVAELLGFFAVGVRKGNCLLQMAHLLKMGTKKGASRKNASETQKAPQKRGCSLNSIRLKNRENWG